MTIEIEYNQLITFNDYITEVITAAKKVDDTVLSVVEETLLRAYNNSYNVYVVGNGGSASLSQHFSCDHSKGLRYDTKLKAHAISLASNISLMTAISNDFSYDEVFSKQIEYTNDPKAVLIAISASGNSPNIIRALEEAKKREWSTIAFVGFNGGKILKENLADSIVHVPCENYGMVEDIHQMIMHYVSQKFRRVYDSGTHILKL
jgi:phosphoheptose isomerase